VKQSGGDGCHTQGMIADQLTALAQVVAPAERFA